jgi:hypothetical protein
LWLTIWMALGLLSLAAVASSCLNHDVAWYLYGARVLLQGGTVYRDVVDTNPPLIFWLNLPVAWTAEQFGLNSAAVFKSFVYAAAALSALVSARLLRIVAAESAGTRRLLTAVLVFAMLPFARPEGFGQREHLMVLLTMPYLLAAVGWATGDPPRRRAALAVGVAGGLGFAMKPHYLLAWLAVEAALPCLATRRGSWRRPEAIGAAAAIVGYGLAVVLLVPQYLEVVAQVRQLYGGMDSPASLLFRLVDVRLWAVAAVLMAIVRLPEEARPAPWVLFAAWTGFLLAALLQLKGWSYHLYPARTVCLVFFVALACRIYEALPALGSLVRGGGRGLGAAVLVTLFIWSGRYVVEAKLTVESDLVTPLVKVLRQQAPGGTFAALSMRTMIYPAFPAVNYAGVGWSLRHPFLWFLPGLYEAELRAPGPAVVFRAPTAMPAVERAFYEEIIGDLCARPPDVLMIEAPQPRAPLGRRALDLSAYYGQDDRYGRLSASYDPLPPIGQFLLFKRARVASCEALPEPPATASPGVR